MFSIFSRDYDIFGPRCCSYHHETPLRLLQLLLLATNSCHVECGIYIYLPNLVLVATVAYVAESNAFFPVTFRLRYFRTPELFRTKRILTEVQRFPFALRCLKGSLGPFQVAEQNQPYIGQSLRAEGSGMKMSTAHQDLLRYVIAGLLAYDSCVSSIAH